MTDVLAVPTRSQTTHKGLGAPLVEGGAETSHHNPNPSRAYARPTPASPAYLSEQSDESRQLHIKDGLLLLTVVGQFRPTSVTSPD